MSSVPLMIFNANLSGVGVVVNNGPQFSINGTSAVLRFIPQRPDPTVAPTFSFGQPAPNVFGIGWNYVVVTPVGAPAPFTPIPINITDSQQIISVQVYIFWESASTVSCFVLNNGQILTQYFSNSAAGSPVESHQACT